MCKTLYASKSIRVAFEHQFPSSSSKQGNSLQPDEVPLQVGGLTLLTSCTASIAETEKASAGLR